FYSPYDNAQIKIQYGNKNSNFVLEKKGDTKLLSLIQSFSPSLPEYIYFTATCNVPFFVMSFSSGKNFGGEFSPGYHGAYLDTDFTMISSRISKEFSKDQKSLIEIYSQHPHTKATFSNSNPENDQTVTLNEFAIYNYSSSSSLEKVNISSDEPLLCLQLHNYTNKGLFYYVPPLDNTAITFSFSTSPSDQGGLFAHQSNTTLHPQMFFYPPRWKAFFLQILNPDLVLFTVFFAGLLILLFIIFILLVFKHRKEDIDSQFTVSSSHQTLHTPSTNSNEEPFSLPEKENSFSSIEKIHKKSLPTVKKQEPPNDDEMEAKPPIMSFSKEADMQSSNEPIPATQESNKKIRFDPATTPSWLSEEHKEGTPGKTEIDDEEIPPFSSTQRHRKGLRITDPNLEDIDFQEGIPSLDIDEEDIFIQIKGKRTIPKTQQNECQKPSHTSYSSENESTPSSKPLVDPFLTENSSPSTNPIQQEGFQNSSQEPMKTNQAKENLKQTLSKSCSPQNDQNFESKNAKNMIERIYQEPVSEKLTKNTMVPSLENLFYTSVVFDPGSANRLYMEGYLQHFSKGYIGSTSAKKINSSIVALLKSIKLNPNDIAKASTMADVCDTFEEAGKAFALCKKKRIKVYITSYKLPKFLQGITVYSVHDIVKRFHSQDE
ncbi:MAG: hypothetical protein PHI40_03460, partial [Caldisericia bacterium]|nr:hypothetical protein [Caldisericia bacterium]